MGRGRHKKLYYVPGLISLVLLPLLLVYIGADIVKRFDVRGLEINAYHPRNEAYFPLHKRKYKDVILSGNSADDKKSIETAKNLIRGLYAKEDTINGIHFILQDSVSYGTFVGLINFFKADSIRYFAIYGENIWVSYLSPPKRVLGEIPITTECLLCDDVVVVPRAAKQLTIFEQLQNTLRTYSAGIKKLWPTIALLSLLIILTIIQIARRSIVTID